MNRKKLNYFNILVQFSEYSYFAFNIEIQGISEDRMIHQLLELNENNVYY